MNWIEVCDESAVECEDVMRFDYDGCTFAVYRDRIGKYYVTDGMCTHGKVHLADGLVMDHLIECPKHNGRFDYTNGQIQRAPVCVGLKTYEVKIENGKVLFFLERRKFTCWI